MRPDMGNICGLFHVDIHDIHKYNPLSFDQYIKAFPKNQEGHPHTDVPLFV
jgi:hypothetical protein